MARSQTGVLVRISACVGLLACLGVFAAGLLSPTDTPRTAADADPVLADLQRGVHAYREQRYQDAIELLEGVVEQRPELSTAWFRLGLAVHAAGDYERALPMHERATRSRRFRQAAIYNAACAHALLGRPDEALDALERAVDAGYANAEYARNDTDFASLLGRPRFETLLSRMRVPDGLVLRFWVGEWDVLDAESGERVGRNTLSLRNDGRFILEQWTDARGNTGESFNYFDPTQGEWKQVWSDANGVVEFVGERRGDGVLFEGLRLADDPDDRRRLRMHVRPIEDGRVRQTGTRWDEQAQTWEPRYDLIYVPRQPEPDTPDDPAADD